MTCRYCGGAKRIQIVSPVSDHAWADCFCSRKALEAPSPVAFTYEIAHAIDSNGDYAWWRPRLSAEVPLVDPKSIRNVVPLFAVLPSSVHLVIESDCDGHTIHGATLDQDAAAGMLRGLIDASPHCTEQQPGPYFTEEVKLS